MRARRWKAGAWVAQIVLLGALPLPTGAAVRPTSPILSPTEARTVRFLAAMAGRGRGTPAAEALAALALARAGEPEAARRVALRLGERLSRQRPAVLPRKTRAAVVLALSAVRPAGAWPVVARMAATLRDPRHPASAGALAASVQALRAAAHVAWGTFHPLDAVIWRLWGDQIVRRLHTGRAVRTASTADVLAPVADGLMPVESGRRIVLALDHLGVFTPGWGARRLLVPSGALPYAVDTATTLLYAQAAAKVGLRRLAEEACWDGAASWEPNGGLASVRDPVLGPEFGVPLGPGRMAPAAAWILAVTALNAHKPPAVASTWPRTASRPVFPRAPIAVAVKPGADPSRLMAWLLTALASGRRPIVFWNRPWPGFPAEPLADLGHRERMPLWTFGRAGPRPGGISGKALPRPRFESAARALAARVDATFAMTMAGRPALKESLAAGAGPSRPSYLWPLSLWLGGEAALGDGRALAHWLPTVLLYADPARRPAAFTAAAGDPGGVAFFDDNGWLGLDALSAYRITQDPRWLQIAQTIFRFMQSGWAAAADPPGGERFSTTQTVRTETSTGTFLNLALGLAGLTNRSQDWRWARRIMRFNTARMTEGDGLVADVLNRDATFGPVAYPYDSGLAIDADLRWYALTRRPVWVRRARALAYRALVQYEDPVTGRIRPDGTIDPAEHDAFVAVFLDSLAHLDAARPAPWIARPVLAEARYLTRYGRTADGLYRADWTRFGGSAKTPPRLVTQAAALTVLAAAARVDRVKPAGR